MGYFQLNHDNGLAILVIKSNGNNQLFIFLFLFLFYMYTAIHPWVEVVVAIIERVA